MTTLASNHLPAAPASTPAPVRSDVAAVFLLGGGVSPSPLSRQTSRPTLRLPVCHDDPALDCAELPLLDLLLHRIDLPGVPVRLLLDRSADIAPWHRPPRLEALQDAGELRGAGGALRDAVEHLPDDAVVVALPAAQVLLRPLSALLTQLHLSPGIDACIGGSADGTPGTVLLVRAGALRCIKPVGFVDLKEQALPLLARRGRVRARRFHSPVAVSIRTAPEYLRALRLLRSSDGDPARPGFRLVESTPISQTQTHVSPTALVHDSVILAGATVGRDAVVVRSLVCPGAVVPDAAVVIDSVVESSKSATRSARSLSPTPNSLRNPTPPHPVIPPGKEALA